MPAWLLPAALGAASLIGGAQANKAARDEAARNRQFQERLSSTSWQRGVEDMRAAGLNPALAYGAGGASSPGGSMASQSEFIGSAASSAAGGIRLRKELALLDEQVQKTYNDALLSRQQQFESAARRERIYLEQDQTRLGNLLLGLQIPWAEAQAKAAAGYGKYAAPLSLFGRSGAGPLIGSLRKLFPGG